MSVFEKAKKTTKSTRSGVDLKQGSPTQLKKAEVQPTGFDLFDSLIFESDTGKGGLPIGRGKITLLGGDPGSGKTRIGMNLACHLLKQDIPFMYVGFEFESREFVGEVNKLYKYMFGEQCPLDKIYYLDYYVNPFRGDLDVSNIANKSREFYDQTKSPFVFIDSLSEMAKMETMLRGTMDKLNKALIKNARDLCVIGVSQYRGKYDKGIAGGKAMAHKGTAVILVESEELSKWDKEFFPEEDVGSLIRTIRVIKTANYAHPIHKHQFKIDENGRVFLTGKIISNQAGK